MKQIEAKKQKIEFYSYILGLVSFIFLGAMIGNKGVVYMAVIMECISLFVMFINGCSADIIGRLIRSRRKRSQYKEARELYKTILFLQCIFAIFLMVVYFFLSDIFADFIFKMPFLSAAMKFLTPVILLKAWECSVLGYFQGQGSHMPSVVCMVFRQLLFLLFGLIFTGRFVAYGEKVSTLLNNSNFIGMYGAVAICLAILISEILISLFLLVVYFGSDRKKEQINTEEGVQKVEKLSERFRVVIWVSLPEVIIGILKKLPFMLGLVLILWKADDWESTVYAYGLFYRFVVCVFAIILWLVLARLLNVCSRLSVMVLKKDNRAIRECIYAGMHYSWAVGLYVAVCLAVLSPQISNILSEHSAPVLQEYYMLCAVIIAVLVMCVFLWMVLRVTGADRMKYIVLVIMNIAFTVSFLLLQGEENEIRTACIAVLIGCALQMIISFVYIVKKFVLQLDIIGYFVIPILGAAAMGLVMMLIQKLLAPHLGDIACMILCLCLSLIIYLTILVLTRSIKETEINHLYGKLGRKVFSMLIR